jgi:hypothetical protein
MALETVTTPGVYVKEVAKGPRPITAVGMSTPAFIGVTRNCPEGKSGQPVGVSTWTDFTRKFGTPQPDDESSFDVFADNAYLPDAVYGYFNNGGGYCYVVSLHQLDAPASTDEASEPSVVIVQADGKDYLRVEGASSVEVKETTGEQEEEKDFFTLVITTPQGETKTLENCNRLVSGGKDYIEEKAKELEDVQITSIPDRAPPARPEPGIYTGQHGEESRSGPITGAAFKGDLRQRRGLDGLRAFEDIRLLACPDLMNLFDSNEAILAAQKAMIDQCDQLRDRFAILDTPPGLDDGQAREWRAKLGDSSYGALYYPWLQVANFANSSGDNVPATRLVPPSGHVVGVYNRTDGERGVYKAPANEIVRGALGLERELNKEENGELNKNNVNCIRSFTGRGIRIWGARTLSSDTQWRFINVRRLFIMVATSLEEGLQWVTFEPNNQELWAKVRRDISFFLDLVWRSGALFGQTPDEAFYVKCDEELNDFQVRDQGMLIIEVGLAPTKPAEFVIIRLSQWAGQNAESES